MQARAALVALALATAPSFAAAAETRPAKPARPRPTRTEPRKEHKNPGEAGKPEEIVPRREIDPAVVEAPKKEETPLILRWMIRPLRRGMWIRLPIMDTDPNRGITVGAMPIWVIQGETDDRIRAIHAPSVTYNKNFVVTPTYRYYYYPHDDAAVVARGSIGKYENELMGQYEDGSFRGSDLDVFLRVQHDVNAGRRFFGLGPDSSRNGESNYRENMFQYRASAGYPILPESHWRVRLGTHFQASKFTNGPIPNLPTFQSLYPEQASNGRQQTNEFRLSIDYDTRDHAVTTEKGNFIQLFGERATKGVASMYDYNRWGVDARTYVPWKTRPDRVFAIQARLDQVTGPTPPFWLQSNMGGKYSLRAYGEGRYVDRGAFVLNAENRFRVFQKTMAGVTTEFQAAPFVGMGTVFDAPQFAQRRLVRPVLGGSVRAVAKPQVVGSVDFGVGREGLSVFMDINYAF